MVGPDGLLFAFAQVAQAGFLPQSAKPAIPPSRLSLVVKPTPSLVRAVNFHHKKNSPLKGEFFYGGP